MNRMMTWAIAALLAVPFAGSAFANPGTDSLNGQVIAQGKKIKKGKKGKLKRKAKKRNPCRILKRVAKKTKNKGAHKVAKAGLTAQGRTPGLP